MKRTFFVKALWDEEAKAFYCESDIEGLHIEAATLDKFHEIMMDTAADLIMANHFTAPDLAGTPIRELVPAIVWMPPSDANKAA